MVIELYVVCAPLQCYTYVPGNVSTLWDIRFHFDNPLLSVEQVNVTALSIVTLLPESESSGRQIFAEAVSVCEGLFYG